MATRADDIEGKVDGSEVTSAKAELSEAETPEASSGILDAGSTDSSEQPQSLIFLGGAIGVWLGLLSSYALYHLLEGAIPVQVTTFVLVAGFAFAVMGLIPRLGKRAPVFIGVSLGLLVALTLVAVVVGVSV